MFRQKDSADETNFTVHAVLLPSEPYKCSHGISTWKGSLDELKDDDRTVVRSHFTFPPQKNYVKMVQIWTQEQFIIHGHIRVELSSNQNWVLTFGSIGVRN